MWAFDEGKKEKKGGEIQTHLKQKRREREGKRRVPTNVVKAVTSSKTTNQQTKTKNAYNTQYSQAVSHPSTNWALCCLTAVIGREPVYSAWYGRRQRTSSVNLLKGKEWRHPWACAQIDQCQCSHFVRMLNVTSPCLGDGWGWNETLCPMLHEGWNKRKRRSQAWERGAGVC